MSLFSVSRAFPVNLRSYIAMLLLAVFGLPLVLSSVALGQDPESGLPACCRRNGQHHCAMSMAERSAVDAAMPESRRWQAPAERCPYCPASVTVAHFDPFALPGTSALLLQTMTLSARVRQAECRHRIALEGARHKRGPPVISLA